MRHFLPDCLPALAATFLWVAALASTTCGQIRSPFPETPHPAVARIIAPERNGVSFGSGTLVYAEGEYGLVVTNWHVVRDASDEIQVAFSDGFRSPATVAKVDRDWDLAALVVWRPRAEPVSLAQVAPRPGDALTIAGYGSGNYRSARGRCTQYVAPAVDLPFEMVELSTQARQGDSGGPIFNDRNELAGVLFGAGRGTTSGSYAGRVKWFLASVAPNLDSLDRTNIAATSPSAEAESGQPRNAPIAAPVASLDQNSGGSDEATDEVAVLRPVAIAKTNADEIPAASSLPLTLYETPAAGAATSVDQHPAAWQSAVGESMLDHIKTFLAVFGVIAFGYHAVRLATGNEQ